VIIISLEILHVALLPLFNQQLNFACQAGFHMVCLEYVFLFIDIARSIMQQSSLTNPKDPRTRSEDEYLLAKSHVYRSPFRSTRTGNKLL
jgi:hypothetical protein